MAGSCRKGVIDFYPRSPCGERLSGSKARPATQVISIHALLAESDGPVTKGDKGQVVFLSTLSLRRATTAASLDFSAQSFLSTLSLRRATLPPRIPRTHAPDFYPRSPCGERPDTGYLRSNWCPYFYPRSPCGERRPRLYGTAQHTYFYPRSPCGERPDLPPAVQLHISISIHALLAESDPGGPGPRNPRLHFYPRSPCGERHTCAPRPPDRGSISIHALLAESDRQHRPDP